MAKILQFPIKSTQSIEEIIIEFLSDCPFKFWANDLKKQIILRYPWIEKELACLGAFELSKITEPNKLVVFLKEYKKVDWANYGFWIALKKLDRLAPIEISRYVIDWNRFINIGPNRTIKQYWDTWQKITGMPLPLLPYFPINPRVDNDDEYEKEGWFLGECEYGMLEYIRPYCQGVISALIAFQSERPTISHIIIALWEHHPDVFNMLGQAGAETLYMIAEKRNKSLLSWLYPAITCYGRNRDFGHEHVELFDEICRLCGMIIATQRCIKHELIRNQIPGLREWINVATREIRDKSRLIWKRYKNKASEVHQ